jgi:hypothetical protein
MNNECRALLSLVTLPARMNRTQAADYLGFEPDHITLLIKAGLLKPLGRPKPNSDKYFAAVKPNCGKTNNGCHGRLNSSASTTTTRTPVNPKTQTGSF